MMCRFSRLSGLHVHVQDVAQQQAVWATLFAVVVLHREYAANQAEWAGLLVRTPSYYLLCFCC